MAQRDNRPGDGARADANKTAAQQAAARQNAERSTERNYADEPTGTQHYSDKEHSSVPSLVRQLSSEVTSLFTKEISLARSEMRESVDEAKAGAASMAGGGVVLLAGMIILLMAAVYGLATVLSLWLSALIVGGVVTIIGFIMLKGGQSKLKGDSFKPERTQHQLEKDRDTIKKRGTIQ